MFSVSLFLSLPFSASYTSHTVVPVSRNQRLKSLLIDLIPSLISFSLTPCLLLFPRFVPLRLLFLFLFLVLSSSVSYSCRRSSLVHRCPIPLRPSDFRERSDSDAKRMDLLTTDRPKPTHNHPTDPTHRPTDRSDRIQPTNLTTLSTVHYRSTATSRALTPSPAFAATLTPQPPSVCRLLPLVALFPSSFLLLALLLPPSIPFFLGLLSPDGLRSQTHAKHPRARRRTRTHADTHTHKHTRMQYSRLRESARVTPPYVTARARACVYALWRVTIGHHHREEKRNEKETGLVRGTRDKSARINGAIL